MGKAKRRRKIGARKPGTLGPRASEVPADAGPLGHAGFFLILAAAIGIQLIDIQRPFVDRHDWASAHQAQFGRNHVRYGLAETRTRCVYSKFVQHNQLARQVYPDHPPLLSLLLALGMAAFGVSEITVHATAGTSTVVSIGLTMWLARSLFGRSISLLTGLALLPMPILVYFGHIPTHENLALPFALLTLRGYLGWLLPEQFKGHPGRNAALFATGTLLMILTSWLGMIIAGIIWLHFALRVFRGRVRGSPGAWCLATLPAAGATLVTLTHVLWSVEWNLEHLYGLFAYRSGINQPEVSFTTGSWLVRQVTWLWRDYTAVGVALAGLGLLLAIQAGLRRSAEPSGKLLRYAVPLVVPSLLWVLVFRNGSFVHEYWWLPATPFVAMLIALALSFLSRVMRRYGKPAAALAVGLPLVAMAAEMTAHYKYFRGGRSTDAMLRDPCQYINARTSENAVVIGNAGLWVERPYYEGATQILRPSVAWYLDRLYVQAETAVEVSALTNTGEGSYYLFIPMSKEDRALRGYLLRTFKLEAQWPDVYVFNLLKKATR